ncbi:MAG: SRPBCC domain-containing protein [Thermoanaerobaculia bacterium]|nr:SRPBCC domain-containing protein [Thermoanaerobaculia bacterium]
MIATESELSQLTLGLEEDIFIEASIEASFAALLEQMGPSNEMGDGTPMPMVLEAVPGGRWFRDLGDDNGHNWATVQAIRRPDLLELSGPLFMSYPVCNNVQYRLAAEGDGTRLTLRHNALGLITEDHRQGVREGWRSLLQKVRSRAQSPAVH